PPCAPSPPPARNHTFATESGSWRASSIGSSRHTLHVWCDGSGRQPLPASPERPIDDAAGELPAPNDQSWNHALNYYPARLHIEIDQRFAAVLVRGKDGRQLGVRPEDQSRLHTIVPGLCRLQGGFPAVPVVV